MKKLTFCVLLLLALCTLLFAGCGDTPPEEQTIDEQITVGMTYEAAMDILMPKAVRSEWFYDVYVYDTGDEEDLYVFFESSEDGEIRVAHVERLNNLEPTIGMTRDEVNALFKKQGKRCSDRANIYTWEPARYNDHLFKTIYGWFDSDDKLVRYTVSQGVPNLTLGLTYEETVGYFLREGESVQGVYGLYKWMTTTSGKYYYVRFDEGRVVDCYAEYEDISVVYGMSYEKVARIYATEGIRLSVQLPVYAWRTSEDSIGIFSFTEENDRLVLSHRVTVPSVVAKGENIVRINEALGTDGESVANVPNLYKWELAEKDRYLYVRFEDNTASEIFVYDDIDITLGATYERLVEIYGTVGTKVGRWDNIYSWQTSEDSIGIFKFEDDNGALKLLQFVPSIADISVGMTFSELNESLGAVGVDAGITTTKVYKWDTELEENLYVWFDSELIATKFCFAKDGDVELKAGVPYVDVLYILDAPYDFSYRWITTEETDICIRFVQDESTEQKVLEEIFRIPKLDVYKGMTREYVVELMGKEAEWSFGSGNTWYVWPIEDSGVWLCVAFNDNGAYSINFSKADSVVFPVRPVI